MLHALYILAFAILAFLAVRNLIRNLILLGTDARREPHPRYADGSSNPNAYSAPHPEMLDEAGRIVSEPLLVMKSITLEDARQQLDALFDGSASSSSETSDEEG